MSGCLRIGIPIVILILLAIYSAFPHPTRSETTLKAIARESQHLLAAHPPGPAARYVNVPMDAWPPVIAGLEPYSVLVGDGFVHISMRPSFDGGWGYGFAPDRRNLSMLPECWSELGHGAYWHGPC